MADGELFVVATPIGNLADFTYRAVEVLRSVDCVLAEDTRHTKTLLAHYGIEVRSRSLHAHSSEAAIESYVQELEGGAKFALVSDAGTPLVSDPGGELVRAAVARNIRVTPIPGASAVFAALVGSGFGGAGFRFFGFLPREGGERLRALNTVLSTPETVLFFESPQRTLETLREMAELAPDRPACIARELTKRYEEFVRGTLRELSVHEGEMRGEVVIVLGPHEVTKEVVEERTLDEWIAVEMGAGQSAKDAALSIAKRTGLRKGDIYNRIIEWKRTQK